MVFISGCDGLGEEDGDVDGAPLGDWRGENRGESFVGGDEGTPEERCKEEGWPLASTEIRLFLG